jgi:hypothetical protein
MRTTKWSTGILLNIIKLLKIMNNKLVYIVAGAALLVGSVGSIAFQTFAAQQTAVVTPALTAQTPTPATSTTPDPVDAPGTHGHRPLGGDGVISSISGTTIVMAEEGDEGAASYTVDASKATITNNGVAATLSDLKAGDKVFVDGPVSGTTVVATTISLGHPGNKGNDASEGPDQGGAPETNDAAN